MHGKKVNQKSTVLQVQIIEKKRNKAVTLEGEYLHKNLSMILTFMPLSLNRELISHLNPKQMTLTSPASPSYKLKSASPKHSNIKRT